jgi:Putative adhesin
MDARTVAAAAALAMALVAPAGCAEADTRTGGSTTTDQQSYEITEPVDALVVDARAATVIVEGGDGPLTVDETYHFSDDKPATSHRVDGSTLHLTDSGCRNDDVRCDVEFRVHLPAAARTEITSQAGAVRLTGLTGDVAVSTRAGAVEGRGLGGDEVSVETQAGAARLEFARPPSTVRASTEVGAVEVRVPGDTTYAVDVQTTVGRSDISVQRDPSSAHRIQIRTSVGAVKVAAV